MFPYFTENNLSFQNQLGFMPGASWVNQLISITREIFPSFDNNYKVRGIFFDISNAFDKACFDGIIHKLHGRTV